VNQNSPSKEELLQAYHWLDENHPHHLLPLETRLPDELQHKRRHPYRIIMAMLFSGAQSEKRLTTCLGKLFKRHPGFESLRNLNEEGVKNLLGKEPLGIGLGLQDPDVGGNGARAWSLLQCYFGPWRETITEAHILTLGDKKGFGGGKFVRVLQAYCCGNREVLPLDERGCDALRDSVFPGYLDGSDERTRNDIENKLRGESRVCLIDFHELLRFVGQDSRANSQRAKRDIIIGWNAWRLLCSAERAKITEAWIYEHLVEDKGMARELWSFIRRVEDL